MTNTLIGLISKIKILLFFLFLIDSLTFLYSQTYDFKAFGLEEGLPQSQLLSLCQDSEGNIWMGTNNGGVGKYDGNNFTNYTENTGLINNIVYSIHTSKNGDVFLGTNGGLSIYNGKRFRNYIQEDGLPNNRIYRIIEDEKGTIWIGTSKGVCIFKNNNIIPFNKNELLNNSAVYSIFIDSKSRIHFGTQENGVIIYNPQTETFVNYTVKDGLFGKFIFSINEDFDGSILVGTPTGANRITKNGTIERVNLKGNENIGFFSIIRDQKNIWLGTNNGLYKYDGKQFTHFTIDNGLPSNIVYTLLVDREDNLWIGTNGCGAAKFTSEAFRSYNSENKLPGDYVTYIFNDSKKNMWLAIAQYGVVKMRNDSIVIFNSTSKNAINNLVYDEVQTICEDDLGNIFLGTQDGLSVFDGKKFTNYKFESEYSNNIYSLYKDSKGVIWVGTKNGLFNFIYKKIVPAPINTSEIFKDENIAIYCMTEDKENNLWLGTEKGVIRYSGNSAILFNKKSGFTDKRVSSITKDNANNLWFGTDEGIFLYNYKTFSNINENSGLVSNKIYSVLQSNSKLWIGTNKGLNCLDLLNYYSNKKISLKHYSKDEGFKGVECNLNSACKDYEGNLWFGTIKGASVFNPKLEKTNLKEPITKISGIRLFFEKAENKIESYCDGINDKTLLPINLSLPHNQNHITFDFIGISTTIPSKVKYQFMLEGSDKDWSPIISKTEATYSSLDPGYYTFYLKAMNNDGLWNNTPVTFSFTISPPWWATWWFYSICGILLLFSIYTFINIRTESLKRAKIKLENEVKIRTNQLREEKEKVEVINKEVSAQKAIIEAKNQDITDSIKYAKNIQEAILPPLKSLYDEFKELFIIYQPKDIVSGDFYWFQKRNDKKLIAAVDCTGHGVPGAFMSIVGNTLLNEIVNEKNITEPSSILNELHKGVKEALKQNEHQHERQDGMDIALCLLDEKNSSLEFSGANRPLWIFRHNLPPEKAFEQIKADKFPIGGMEIDKRRMYSNHKITVEKGDIIYMFSDGYADQFGGDKGKKFMVGNLQKKILEIYHLPILEQENILRDTFQKWKGNLEQIDDVLVVAFKIS